MNTTDNSAFTERSYGTRPLTAGESLRAEFGRKIYKLALDIGCTCPNRDGRAGSRGCIFCSSAGGGDFAERFTGRQEELDRAKQRLGRKIDVGKAGFIAYFQNFTNTYGPAERLEPLFNAALSDPSVKALSIATRPDCLPPEIIEMLERLAKKTVLFVELGLQTIHEKTAAFIRRGYPLETYDRAVSDLKKAGARVVTHLIFGLPYPAEGDRLVPESREMMLESVKYVARSGVCGVKFQLLHVLKGTDLAGLYLAGAFPALTEEEYRELIVSAVRLLPPEIVIHRFTGDPPRKLLIAPAWCTDKKGVLNRLNKALDSAFGAG